MGRKNGWFSKVKKVLSHESKGKRAETKRIGKENPSFPDTPDPGTQLPLHVTPLKDSNSNSIHLENEEGVIYDFESREEVAAIRIQAAFRSYTARRGLRTLRGLLRLKSLVEGPIVRRHTSNTLKCMQGLSRVQSHIQTRRLRVLEENRALQRRLLQQCAKELDISKIIEEWDDSMQSKEQIEENLQHKHEAATRREKALAYSHTHQQTWKRSSTKPTSFLFMDTTNPQWGWSWIERWIASVPNESEKKIGVNSEKNPPSSPASQKVSATARTSFSIRSDRNRRHMVGTGDDESSASSCCTPRYMAPTHSARAKLKLAIPLGAVSEKRLSFTPSPARPRRLSTSRKVESN